MNRENKKFEKYLLYGAVLLYCIMSVSILLMPIGAGDLLEGPTTIGIVTGIIFWAGLILGSVCLILLSIYLRRHSKLYRSKKGLPGIVCIFKNKPAIVFDSLTAVSFVLFLVSMAMTRQTGFICYVFLAVFVFSSAMHCILNGKMFRYIFVNKI